MKISAVIKKVHPDTATQTQIFYRIPTSIIFCSRESYYFVLVDMVDSIDVLMVKKACLFMVSKMNMRKPRINKFNYVFYQKIIIGYMYIANSELIL